MKPVIHAVLGATALGLALGVSGLGLGSWRYWLLLIIAIAWYHTKPERI